MTSTLWSGFRVLRLFFFFFFNDTATTEIYTLSLHDALPISETRLLRVAHHGRTERTHLRTARPGAAAVQRRSALRLRDRKSTRLNSSHGYISYAVFCLKKKKKRMKKLSNQCSHEILH